MFRQFLISILLSLVIPGLVFGSTKYEKVNNDPPQQIYAQVSSVPQITVQLAGAKEDEPVYIPVLGNGLIEEMELEDYVLGVVLGEMPASFEPEALKAQAVAARTYALRCSLDSNHEANAVCKDYRCCQAYCDPQAYLNGKGSQEKFDRVAKAVKDTAGLVATYQGKLIFAVYFASSGGRTEDASEVWGNSFGYLKSVSSPGEADTAHQNSKVTFTAAQFQEKLEGKISGDTKNWFGKVTYTKGGGVKTMVIGGKTYSGVKLRNLLGLKSTKFSVKVSGNTITITTNGHGHRVGLSQYGAQAMAKEGRDFAQILAHYYSGINIEKYPLSGD